MSYKRILTVQDISCLGQCSLTVALPILSACGLETCILPSAILSTHTGGFKGYTIRDLTDDIPKIEDHWKKENIKFDGVYTGYLGSKRQIDYVIDIMNTMGKEDCVKIVDPACADNGVLYPGFDKAYVDELKKPAANADVILPNITEACYLTDTVYLETYNEKYIEDLLASLMELGCGAVVLTGVSFNSSKTGVMVYKGNKAEYYEHKKIPEKFHGTGDIYASAFSGALMNGIGMYESAGIAADYTVKCIERTIGDKQHWYGVKFEPVLKELITSIEESAR